MRELINYIRRLLECAELNQNDLEPQTRETIKNGQSYLRKWDKEKHHASS